jgi:hypothetical protein
MIRPLESSSHPRMQSSQACWKIEDPIRKCLPFNSFPLRPIFNQTDLMDLPSAILFEQLNLIHEESHGLLIMRSESPIAAIHWIQPSMSIIPGDNSDQSFHKTSEICHCAFIMDMSNNKHHRPFMQNEGEVDQIWGKSWDLVLPISQLNPNKRENTFEFKDSELLSFLNSLVNHRNELISKITTAPPENRQFVSIDESRCASFRSQSVNFWSQIIFVFMIDINIMYGNIAFRISRFSWPNSEHHRWDSIAFS